MVELADDARSDEWRCGLSRHVATWVPLPFHVKHHGAARIGPHSRSLVADNGLTHCDAGWVTERRCGGVTGGLGRAVHGRSSPSRVTVAITRVASCLERPQLSVAWARWERSS